MFPEKYVKDIESSARRDRVLRDILVSGGFLLSFILLGPLIHEYGHVITLELIGCGYFMNIGFSLPHGIFASIEPLCTPGNAPLIVFYMIGYVLTLGLGSVFVLLGNQRRYLAGIGTGMLLSVILTVGIEGDIHSTAVILGLESFSTLLTALIILGVFITSLRGLEKMV